jgi:hypothetical protein
MKKKKPNKAKTKKKHKRTNQNIVPNTCAASQPIQKSTGEYNP